MYVVYRTLYKLNSKTSYDVHLKMYIAHLTIYTIYIVYLMIYISITKLCVLCILWYVVYVTIYIVDLMMYMIYIVHLIIYISEYCISLVFGKVFTLLFDIICWLSTFRFKSMGGMLSSSSLLFDSLQYLPVALPDRETCTAVLHSLMSLNWNCTFVFFFKVGGFGSSDS